MVSLAVSASAQVHNTAAPAPDIPAYSADLASVAVHIYFAVYTAVTESVHLPVPTAEVEPVLPAVHMPVPHFELLPVQVQYPV